MNEYNFILSNMPIGKLVWIEHLGKVKVLGFNKHNHAVVNFNGNEMTLMNDIKVKLKE